MLRHYCLLPLICYSLSYGGPLPRPKLNPVATTEAHRQVIASGVRLHDQGDYAGAMLKYAQVLKENPHDVSALHELSYTYFARKEYRNALETATQGAQYDSTMLVHFYMTMGSTLDMMGKRGKSIQVYRAALKRIPKHHLLHYNLAITYISAKKPKKAKASLKNAARLYPRHPSSHIALGQLYLADGYRIPALLAYSRFLVLEPRSPRSAEALAAIGNIIGGNVRKDGEDQLTILVNFDPDSEEGDFTGAELALSIGTAAGQLPEEQEKSKTEAVLTNFVLLFEALGNDDELKQSPGFAAAYYAPYFAAIHTEGYTQAMVYHILQATTLLGVGEWLEQNRPGVEEFLGWSREFHWNRD